MSETIEAKELQLVNIFSDSYRFEIPDYQRPYAWTTEQTGELLDDLLYAMERIENVSDASPYFLGSIVTIKNGLQPHAQIVDGQQRITTLTILLCVLRELATTQSDKNDTHNYIYAPGRASAGIQGHYRLTVTKRNRKFFQNNIQEMGKLRSLFARSPANLPDSQQRMLENAHHLYESLAKRDEKLRKTLTQFLAQRCYLVVVSASDQNSAYRIFSVLNDRGLDLSTTDILKADIIGVLPEDIRSQHTEIWEKIEEDLGRDRFSDLFAHIRTISVKRRQRGTLQQEFQDHVLKKVDRTNFIDLVLEPYAEAYATVTGASYESADGSGEVNKYLRFLNQLNNFDWIPPAMSFFRRNQNPQAFLHFIRDLERLAYAMFILRAYVSRRTSRYAEILRAIHHKNDLYGPSSPLQLSSKEISDVSHALDGPIYARSRVPRTLLMRLDSLLADEVARYEHATITVEHVLPRNPERNSQWLRDFPDDEERAEWTDKLGNLVLLSRTKNIRALNYDFSRKKKEYFQRGGVATFALTTQVLAEGEWTPAVLRRRQRQLINALKKEWRLEVATPSRLPKSRERSVLTPSESDERKMTSAQRTARDIDETHRKRNQRTMREGSAFMETRQKWEQGLSVEEIASKRGVKKSRVVYHLQRLIEAGVDIDLKPGLPPAERVEEIRRAVRETGGASLSPATKLLGGKYPYYQIKMVWLFLQQQGELSN